MSDFLRVALTIVGVALATFGALELVTNVEINIDGLNVKSSVFMLGFLWGVIVNATVTLVNDLGANK